MPQRLRGGMKMICKSKEQSYSHMVIGKSYAKKIIDSQCSLKKTEKIQVKVNSLVNESQYRYIQVFY